MKVLRTIPSNMNPWICEINGKKYTYPAGTVQDVPTEVAEVIDAYYKKSEGQHGESGSDNLKIMTGTAVLTSTSTGACVYPECNWTRINNKVFASIGFYSSGCASFTVSGLPFTCCTYGASTVVTNFDYDSHIVGNMEMGVAQINRNSSVIKVLRPSTSEAVLFCNLVYSTNDPWPSES